MFAETDKNGHKSNICVLLDALKPFDVRFIGMAGRMAFSVIAVFSPGVKL